VNKKAIATVFVR